MSTKQNYTEVSVKVTFNIYLMFVNKLKACLMWYFPDSLIYWVYKAILNNGILSLNLVPYYRCFQYTGCPITPPTHLNQNFLTTQSMLMRSSAHVIRIIKVLFDIVEGESRTLNVSLFSSVSFWRPLKGKTLRTLKIFCLASIQNCGVKHLQVSTQKNGCQSNFLS